MGAYEQVCEAAGEWASECASEQVSEQASGLKHPAATFVIILVGWPIVFCLHCCRLLSHTESHCSLFLFSAAIDCQGKAWIHTQSYSGLYTVYYAPDTMGCHF